jgi:exosortase O
MKRLTNEQGQRFANILLLGAWVALYQPAIVWLADVFARPELRLNQLMIGGVLLMVGAEIRGGRLRPSLSAPIREEPLPLAIALCGSLAFLAAERLADFNILSALAFGCATYGLLGLWMSPPRWRSGLAPAALAIGALPFDIHLQVFVGYPLRVFTANVTSAGLHALGVASASSETILVVENGLAHVDLPCSGVRSLWTGGMFLLAATWTERRPIRLGWALAAGVLVVLLVLGNIARVATLVLVGHVADQPELAEMMHVPLGVVAFAVACAGAVWFLRRLSTPVHDQCSHTDTVGDATASIALPARDVVYPSRGPRLAISLAVLVALMAVVHSPRLARAEPVDVQTWLLPGLAVEDLPLSDAELEALRRDGADAVSRYAFRRGSLSGSMSLVTSSTWRGHHLPERCLEVNGLAIDGASTHLVAPEFPIRAVSLEGGGQSAAYWFQSADLVTDDYTRRIWSDVFERQTWVLVSVLFVGAVDPADAEARQFFLDLRSAVHGNLPPQLMYPGGKT